MDNIKLDLSVTGNELIVRHGEAEKIYDPLLVELSGTIKAPGDFVEKRKTEFAPLKAHVLANYKELKITLVTNEGEEVGGYVVVGTLILHPDLEKFFINRVKKYTHRDLYDMLKFQGAYFKTKQEHVILLESLRKFEAKVNQEFQSQNDFKGQQAYKKLVDIKTNLALQFTLSLPIFAGQDAAEFLVDICVDTENGGPIFWLESVQMHELIIEKRDEIFETELKRLQDYVIINSY